ncbi:helix-turn-helix transcriptional regulator [Pediococcus pentosaceus]|uniref:helix-turn-helix domain-containing protein n=2 Tax=Pediococcus TaxID=1253 RepID=UPI001F45ADE9|nr:helix-turn-helix transcriptional regulator [Pediococcus pentosaceus]
MTVLTLGQQLKNKRQQAHLSQNQVTEPLHLSRQAISRWKNNQSTPDLSSL